ncbi:MAG TPA: hypothetical protein VH439_05630 [Gemmatimonadales bacterium]|jgi:hypothetical protein
MPARLLVIVAALRLSPAVHTANAVPPADSAPPGDWSALERTTITKSPDRNELIMELPVVDLPAGTMVDQAASVGEFPVSGSIYAFHAEIVDQQGRRLSNELLHHMNVMDPSERELFLPISRRLLASGKETGEIRFPWLLFGARVRAGERILANAMLYNPGDVSYQGVRVRLVLSYVPENRPWPLFSVLPWQLDVAFPVGDKTFDLPPGRSERAYEGSPAVPGKIIVIGGHVHDYATTIELWDATTGKLLWHGEPAVPAPGQPAVVPAGKLYSLTRIGLPVTPSHRYRVRVVYNNTSGHNIPDGGMGVIGGLFRPDKNVVWPATNAADSLYQKDLRHFMGPVEQVAVTMPIEHMHMHMEH